MLDIDKSAEHPPPLESAVADDTHTDTWFTADVIRGVHTYVGLAGEWVVAMFWLRGSRILEVWGMRRPGSPPPRAPHFPSRFFFPVLSGKDGNDADYEEKMVVIDFKFLCTTNSEQSRQYFENNYFFYSNISCERMGYCFHFYWIQTLLE